MADPTTLRADRTRAVWRPRKACSQQTSGDTCAFHNPMIRNQPGWAMCPQSQTSWDPEDSFIPLPPRALSWAPVPRHETPSQLFHLPREAILTPWAPAGSSQGPSYSSQLLSLPEAITWTYVFIDTQDRVSGGQGIVLPQMDAL